MNRYAVFALGVGAGVAVAVLLVRADACCKTVGGAVRDRVGAKLGPTAQRVGDALGVWNLAGGLASQLGVS